MPHCGSVHQIGSFNQPDPAKEDKIPFQLGQRVDLTGHEHNCVAREGKAPRSRVSREREQGSWTAKFHAGSAAIQTAPQESDTSHMG